MPRVYLALGSNLGDRRANLVSAISMLAPEVQVEAVSQLYESAPADGSEQPDYYNCAIRAGTELTPEALLARVKGIELALGREAGPRWSARPIDIDIALYEGVALETAELTIPHPRLTERAFVLRPLLDLDPDLRHPVSGRRFAEEGALEGALRLVAGRDWWREA